MQCIIMAIAMHCNGPKIPAPAATANHGSAAVISTIKYNNLVTGQSEVHQICIAMPIAMGISIAFATLSPFAMLQTPLRT